MNINKRDRSIFFLRLPWSKKGQRTFFCCFYWYFTFQIYRDSLLWLKNTYTFFIIKVRPFLRIIVQISHGLIWIKWRLKVKSSILFLFCNSLHEISPPQLNVRNYNTVSFIKPYQNPVYKCTGSRQGFIKWLIV